MPFLYEGRQHRRKKRESLDCALALRELSDMGVANIITFDALATRVANYSANERQLCNYHCSYDKRALFPG